MYGEKIMIINNRFKMKTTPQETAFRKLSEEGMLCALFEVQGDIPDVDQDWPKNLPSKELDTIYEDYLSAVCWLEYIINPDSAGHSLPRSKYLGEWMQYFEWGLLPYVTYIDFKFKFLHARLVKVMGVHGTPSIKDWAAKEVIR
jgi:hypothetical protein